MEDSIGNFIHSPKLLMDFSTAYNIQPNVLVEKRINDFSLVSGVAG